MAVFRAQDDAQNNQVKDIQTVIGASVKVDGKFHGQGDILIEGQVSGSVKTDKDVIIGRGAKVAANISAANVQIAGEVRGTLKVKGKLDLKDSARVIGDIDTETLAVAPGAQMSGKVTMIKDNDLITPLKIKKVEKKK
jgi:cytoskeletal protein CcmA (bactofilin family)